MIPDNLIQEAINQTNERTTYKNGWRYARMVTDTVIRMAPAYHCKYNTLFGYIRAKVKHIYEKDYRDN